MGFAIAPRLNAAGRLDNMSVGVELLLAESMQEARAQALDLDSLNQARKEIEQGMKLEALEIAEISPHFLMNYRWESSYFRKIGIKVF